MEQEQQTGVGRMRHDPTDSNMRLKATEYSRSRLALPRDDSQQYHLPYIVTEGAGNPTKIPTQTTIFRAHG